MTTLEQNIEIAAGNLPPGWSLIIEVENGWGGVKAIRPDGTEVDLDGDSFDAIASSPPCEEFARAWLPWLRDAQRMEHTGKDGAELTLKTVLERSREIARLKALGREKPN